MKNTNCTERNTGKREKGADTTMEREEAPLQEEESQSEALEQSGKMRALKRERMGRRLLFIHPRRRSGKQTEREGRRPEGSPTDGGKAKQQRVRGDEGEGEKEVDKRRSLGGQQREEAEKGRRKRENDERRESSKG